MQTIKNNFLFSFLLFISLTVNVFAQTPYTGGAIFGDSTTDLGNMPESVLVRPDTETLVNSQRIAANLYVPISNPTPFFNQQLSTIKNNLFLPTQSEMICSAAYSPVTCAMRTFHSTGWTEYLAATMIKAGLLNTNTEILPSYIIENIIPATNPLPTSPKSLFIDYAVYGALAGHLEGGTAQTCYNENQKAFMPTASANCNKPTNLVAYAKQAYTKQAYGNYAYQYNLIKNHQLKQLEKLRTQVVIPTGPQQVRQYLADQHNGRVNLGKHPLYIFYIGANDISVAFQHDIFNFAKMKKLLPNTLPQKTIDAVKLLLSVNGNAKNATVVIVGLYNLGVTPLFTGSQKLTTGSVKQYVMVHWFINPLMAIYNHYLQKKMQQQLVADPHYAGTHFIFADLQKPINKQAGQVKATLGQACDDQNINLLPIEQGRAIDCKNYQFWNAVHPARIMQQQMAATIFAHLP